MATSDGENVYDKLGTVLYCTVPVISAADVASPPDLSDAQNTPLDYDTALTMLEAERAQALHSSSAKGMLSTAAAAPAGGGGGAATHNPGFPSSAADGPPQLADSSLGGSGIIPVPPQPRAGMPNIAGRYGTYGGSQRTTTGPTLKGAGGLNQQPQQQSLRGGSAGASRNSRQDSRLVGLDEGSNKSFDSVAAHNVYVAKLAIARNAAKSEASKKKPKGTGLTTNTAAAAAARLAGGITTGVRTLTVADAMEMLFPISCVDGGDDAVEGRSNTCLAAGVEERQTLASTSASAHGKQSKGDRTANAQIGVGASSGSSLPRLWRRADVGHVSRLDVVLLYLHLQHRCATESVRPRGVVCPNRERLYADALKELTRQITLLCPERGLLLDELSRSMQQSIETYDMLLDSASQYAVRKSTERDLHQHLFAEKVELETEVRRREHRVSEWRAKYAGLQKRLAEQQAADEKLHDQEIAYVKTANMQLVSEIKRLASEAEKAKEN